LEFGNVGFMRKDKNQITQRKTLIGWQELRINSAHMLVCGIRLESNAGHIGGRQAP